MGDGPRGYGEAGIDLMRFVSGSRKELFKRVLLKWPEVPDHDEFIGCKVAGSYDPMLYVKQLIMMYFVAAPDAGRYWLAIWETARREGWNLTDSPDFVVDFAADMQEAFQSSTWLLGQMAALATQSPMLRSNDDSIALVDGALGKLKGPDGGYNLRVDSGGRSHYEPIDAETPPAETTPSENPPSENPPDVKTLEGQ